MSTLLQSLKDKGYSQKSIKKFYEKKERLAKMNIRLEEKHFDFNICKIKEN